PQKTMTAERVKECYRLVKEHDRVGRLADTQEFENFVIDKKRFSNDLMAILEQEIPNKLEDLVDKLLISHLYMESRMTPLIIYMEQC
ncbi:bifunctional isocitrate dehydrogenase kinase/phosphatase, partial [Proteus mirabilis]|uniref:isocitrate dehydrogenase kinase/phosphatase-domain containing protein n=1 Tax=Proteus mirabilis TaxID=584 RepID=UPI002578796D